MTDKKDTEAPEVPGDAGEKTAVSPREKFSRRDFARSSVVAGAVAAVSLPGVLHAGQMSGTEAPPAGVAVSTGNSSGSSDWREGTTIPAEYYYDADHYKNDERFIADNFWLLADHVSRIPEPGDFFVFKYGIGESAIVVRNETGDIGAFHNVCRHRGSRLCRHDEDPKPGDDRLSVRQLGESGNAQLFRCPYHAWLYDLDGTLIDAYDVHDDFDMAANGLVKCHMRVEEGNIFLNFSQAEEPPEFDAFSNNENLGRLQEMGKKYSLADLKVGVRESYVINANWKLAIENFLECYHCGASHTNLVTTHNWDYTLTDSQKTRRLSQMTSWLGEEPDDRAWETGGGPFGGLLNPGYVTGSVDGKAVAPLLPGVDDWSHETGIVTTGQSTGYWQAYDDHVAVARFTPRGPELTDCEIFWLVHPDAVAGKDFDPEKVKALWHITIQEDIWIVENNHVGVKSGAYSAGRYSKDEGSPSSFVAWYMRDVVKV
jgi:phenylpropionate dioxygenase-like ring-hydroxylating dioxygenase large terminal subunit